VVEYSGERQLSINHHWAKTVFLAASHTLRYADVEVIDVAKGAGVQRVGIITDGMRRAEEGSG